LNTLKKGCGYEHGLFCYIQFIKDDRAVIKTVLYTGDINVWYMEAIYIFKLHEAVGAKPINRFAKRKN